MGFMPIGGSFRGRDDDAPAPKCNHSTVYELLTLIRKLAPIEGIHGNEYGECVWCGADCTRENTIHESDCAWLRAQAVLMDSKG